MVLYCTSFDLKIFVIDFEIDLRSLAVLRLILCHALKEAESALKNWRLTGSKISENVNYTERGTMEGPKALSEARRREVPECRGGGVWGGAP